MSSAAVPDYILSLIVPVERQQNAGTHQQLFPQERIRNAGLT